MNFVLTYLTRRSSTFGDIVDSLIAARRHSGSESASIFFGAAVGRLTFSFFIGPRQTIGYLESPTTILII